MAGQHGGRAALPPPPPPAALHLSTQTASVHTSTQPLTAPLPPLRSVLTTAHTTTQQPASVSLHAPRPHTDRTLNEYVETPFRAAPLHAHQLQQPPPPPPPPPPPDVKPARATRLHLPLVHPHQHQHAGPASSTHLASHALVAAITKQPVAFTKEHPGRAALSSTGSECASSSNIMCRECGRCRCESCRSPRALPERWVCDEACLCSAGALIDYASCLCCVKGLYYHCSNTDAGATCADEPCSCGPHRRLARWACLGALAALLPCLLCYWPLRVCQRAVEAAYARHSRAGCRCRPATIAPAPPLLTTPEKRLLSDSSPEY